MGPGRLKNVVSRERGAFDNDERKKVTANKTNKNIRGKLLTLKHNTKIIYRH